MAPWVNRYLWLWLPVELRVHRLIEIVGLQLDSLEERIQQDKSLAIVLDPKAHADLVKVKFKLL